MDQHLLANINYHKKREAEEGCFLCAYKKLVNDDAYYCQKFMMEVDSDWSCNHYLSLFKANPDLLKPFIEPYINQSPPKKKKSLFSRLFK